MIKPGPNFNLCDKISWKTCIVLKLFLFPDPLKYQDLWSQLSNSDDNNAVVLMAQRLLIHIILKPQYDDDTWLSKTWFIDMIIRLRSKFESLTFTKWAAQRKIHFLAQFYICDIYIYIYIYKAIIHWKI